MIDLDLSDEIAHYARAAKGCSPAPTWVTALGFDARGERLAVGALGAGRVFEFDVLAGGRPFEYDVRDVLEASYNVAWPADDGRFDAWANDGVYLDTPVFTPDGRHLVARLNALVDNNGTELRTVLVFARRGARVWSRTNVDDEGDEPAICSPWAVSPGGTRLAHVQAGSVSVLDVTTGEETGREVRLKARDVAGRFGETLVFRDDGVAAVASRGVCLVDVDAGRVLSRHALSSGVDANAVACHVFLPRAGGLWLVVRSGAESDAWAIPHDARPDAPFVHRVKLPRDASLVRYDAETDETLWWRNAADGASVELVRCHLATGRIESAKVPAYLPPLDEVEAGAEPPFEIHPPGIVATPDGTRLAFVTPTGVRVVPLPERWNAIDG